MASFYNNYYRYYRPYRFPLSHHSCSSSDKSLPKQDLANATASLSSSDCSALLHDANRSSKFSNQEKISPSYSSFGPVRFKNPLFSDIEEPVFEVFGIELYLDDIIIVGLLFFLYQEGVQDELLFLALFLLLVA